ncbi:unnamed protein product [Caenorhabditis nigoni]
MPDREGDERKRAIGRLTTEFVRNESRKIVQKWIIFIYKKNGFNEVKAREELRRDEGVRKEVEKLHVDRDTCDDSKIKSAIENKINFLIRGRNHPLGTLHQVPYDQLIFDLHWFTLQQAERYLDCLIRELESHPRRVSGDIPVQLIVGRGDSSDWTIRSNLLKKFSHNVSESEWFSVLILTIRKKAVYSDLLDWSAVL